MSRAALRAVLAFLAVAAAGAATGLDPHVDSTAVPASCAACHEGHGASRSPMLPAPQADVCLSCHGSQAERDRRVLEGSVSPALRPSLLSSAMAQPYTHPIDDQAFSRREPGVVTCTSCHSPHRGGTGASVSTATVDQRVSPRDPTRFEYQLCESCHGDKGSKAQSLTDISRLLDPANRSYHPVEAPSVNGSYSALPAVAGRLINCTDCHGNADPAGPRGPHGSTVPFILRGAYSTVDGIPEGTSAYGLCYGCHDRTAVLDSTAFPGHGRHIVDYRASCATCHNPHGSLRNRGLIRFGEETFLAGVSPSASTGVLAFDSSGPGSGTCYLTCHGVDHAPESYGTVVPGPAPGTEPTLDAAWTEPGSPPSGELPRPTLPRWKRER